IMSNQSELTRLEFVLTLGGNIICQRFFYVKNHTADSKNSMDIHHYMSEICLEIGEELKRKTFLYLTTDKQYSFSFEENDKQTYLLELKQDDRPFYSRCFSANVYHPKVRYSVD